jgi:hypothetical protein
MNLDIKILGALSFSLYDVTEAKDELDNFIKFGSFISNRNDIESS